MSDRINPIEGYYCSEKCVKLAKSLAQWTYFYYHGRAKFENARGDINAYGNRLTQRKLADLVVKMNAAQQ